MAKRYTYLIFILFICACTRADDTFFTSISQSGENELTLTLKGTVEEGWHATVSVEIEQADGVEPRGDLQKKAEGHYEQRLRVTKESYSLLGFFRYILCDDQMCLAPETVDFEYQGSGFKIKAEVGGDKAEAPLPDEAGANLGTDSIAGAFPPPVSANDTVLALFSSPLWQPVMAELRQGELPGADGSAGADGSVLGGLLDVILFGFIGGLLAILTPCVWPIIPLTVSFFMKRGKGKRDALLFGASIVVLFLALGFLVTLLFGADAMNALSTSAVFNLACFVVLLIFGLSLLGLFELRLPSKWGNNLDEMAEKRTGMISIFLMALTLVVVSFSCTAPVIGLLLVEVATHGHVLAPMLGMSSFAIALALPFSLFALFPQWLKGLPRSGSWMDTAKVALATLEIAFSLKFLSVADQAHGWGLLSPKVFLVLWSTIFGGFTVYLCLKGLRKKGDAAHSRKGIFSPVYALLCIFPLLLTVYLVQGIFTGKTAFVSAFLPVDTSVEHDGRNHFRDYEEGMLYAQQTDKPVFLDFTGYGCVNCRKMEGAVFTDERVKQRLERDFVIIELYVDDRTALPQRMEITDPTSGKLRTLRTVGDKWSLLERYKFGAQSQPLYVLLTPEGHAISPSYGYDENIDKFLRFLGLAERWRRQ